MKMRKLIALMVAVMMLFGITAPAGGATLSDITGHWAQQEIQALYEQGIISGYDGKFDPEGKVTRAQFAKIIANAMKLVVEKPAQSTFNDVPGDKWYYDFVETAYRAGIVNGMGNSKFEPNANITREQIAAMFVRALGLEQEAKDKAGQALTVKDADQVSPWAVGYVAVAYERGLVNGRSDGSFDPKGDATRAEAAAIGKRFLDKVPGIFGTIQGRVSKKDSADGVKDASITVVGNGMKFVVKSDDKGLYTVMVPAGTYKLTANADGYFNLERDGVKVARAAGTTAQLVMVPRAEAGLAVTVIDGNAAPVDNARVALVDKDQKETVMTSAYKGIYQFTNVKPGEYTLKVSKDKHETVARGVVMTGQAKAEGVTLREYKEVAISGAIKNTKGEKVNADKVEFLDGEGRVIAAQTNVENYSVRDKLPSGNYTLLVSDAVYAVSRTNVAVEEGVNKTVDAALADGYTVTVNIKDATTLNPVTSEPKVEFISGNVVYNEATADKVYGTAISTRKLATGNYTIKVSGKYVVTKESAVIVGTADTTAMVQVEQGGTVNGTVYSGATKLEKAAVTLKTAAGTVVKTVETDANGKYEFPGLAAGNYKVEAVKAGYVNFASGEVKVEAGKDAVVEAPMAANPASLKISGFLRENVVNTLVTTGSVEVLDKDGKQVSLNDIPTGQYGLDLVPGTYTLIFRATGYETVVKSMEVKGEPIAQNIFMEVGGNAGVKVTVKDADTNGQVTTATVTAVDAYGKKVYTFTKDANGDYVNSKLPAGTYTVSVSAGSKFGGETKVTVAKAGTANVTVTVAAVKALKGKVVNTTGTVLEGDVVVIDAEGKVVNVVKTSAGNYVVSNLKTGSYAVKVLVDGYEVGMQTVTITATDVEKNNVNFVLGVR
ncbi:MAG: carboxypeptidase regulatory-like domain-containing protein [Clostridia bacterium]|nr:carboxypeptidase regulatory-like domain-containing protein [Clostridia bacterium]